MRDLFKTTEEKGRVTGKMEMRVLDKNGNPKQLWDENRLGRFLRSKGGLSLQGVPFLGKWAETKSLENLVVDAGLAGIASRINGAGAEAVFEYLAVGSGTTSPVDGDTALEAEIATGGASRAAATTSRETTNVSDDTAVLDYTWSITAALSITEAGALNDTSSGVLLGRQVFSAVNVSDGDSFQLTYKFTAS